MVFPELSQGVVGLLAAAALTVAPSLCFVALVRGLERLRDDQLVDRLVAQGVLDPTAPGVGDAAGNLGTVTCRHCEAENPIWARHCGSCRRELR